MYKIYIDPSKNNEMLANGYFTEKEILEKLSKNIENRLLKEDNMIVYINMNSSIPSNAITEYNNMNYNVYISIEISSEIKKGFEVIVADGNQRSQTVGQKVYQKIQKVYYDQSVDLGINYDKNQNVLLTANNAPIIINIISNENQEDAKWLVEKNELIGTNIAEGIIEGLKLFPC